MSDAVQIIISWNTIKESVVAHVLIELFLLILSAGDMEFNVLLVV